MVIYWMVWLLHFDYYLLTIRIYYRHYIAVDSLLTDCNRCNGACSWKAFAIVRVSIEPEDVAHLKAMTSGSIGKQSLSVLSSEVSRRDSAEQHQFRNMMGVCPIAASL